MKIRVIIFIIFFTYAAFTQSISVLPKPVDLEIFEGAFSITPFTKIIIQKKSNKDTEQLQWVANYLDNQFFGKDKAQKDYHVIRSKMVRPQRIMLSVRHYFRDLGAEGYKISVFPNMIIISGNTAKGIFNGVQTLLQLAKPVKILESELYYSVPCVKISDFPRFGWRGTQLDAAHYYDKDEIKKYIDLMAYHKLNILLWQLSDNEHFSMEIKQFPHLTNSSSFYSQEDIKEIIDYASKRFITVVPQINLIGHAKFLTKTIPQLSSNCQNILKNESEIICPSDTSFKIINQILAEIFELFPSKHIHIGGDKIDEEIQKDLFNNIEKYSFLNGKSVICWDEFSNYKSLIMTYENQNSAIQNLRFGNQAIIASKNYFYFENQDENSENTVDSKKIYGLNPVPKGLDYEQATNILGIQATIISKNIASFSELELLLLPRLSALAEIGWTFQDNRNYNEFLPRANKFSSFLKGKDYNIYIPSPRYLGKTTFINHQKISFEKPDSNTTIFYTTDGKSPLKDGIEYESPFTITENTNLRAVAVSNLGESKMISIPIIKEKAKEAIDIMLTINGLNYNYYENFTQKINQIDSAKATRTSQISTIKFPSFIANDNFAIKYYGYIFIPSDDIYTFYIAGDEAVKLKIDEDSEILHTNSIKNIESKLQVAIKKGFHKFEVKFMESLGAEFLKVSWESNTILKKEISKEFFFRE